MARPILSTVFFDSFARGEFGKAGSWDVGWRLLRQQLLYAGWFTATNVQRSLQGSLYPRSGLVDISPTGVPNGTLSGFVWTAVANRDLLFSVGTAVYDAPSVAGGAATVYTGAFAVTPTVPVAFVQAAGGIVYATVYGDKTYKIDQNARTVTALSGSPGGKCIAIYGQRLVVANVSGNPNRLFFSGDDSNPPASEADMTIWNASNWIDIGDGWDINLLQLQRTALIVGKQLSWHLITGVLGSSQAVRQLNSRGPWVQAPQMAAMAGDNTVWFVDFNRDTPSLFNGSKMGEEPFLSFNGGVYAFTALPPTFAVCRGYRNSDVVMAAVTTPGGSMRLAIMQEGAWTFHTFSPPGGFAGAWVAGGDGHSAGLRFSNGGGVSTPAKFYAWVTERNRPAISGQALESNTDAGTAIGATVTLPEYYVRGGEDLQVRAVMVDFVRWNGGWGANNHFDCQVQALNTVGDLAIGAGAPGNVLTESWDESPSGGGSAGQSTPGRVVLGFEGERGNGFQVSFANVFGVEIRKVEVHFEPSGPANV